MKKQIRLSALGGAALVALFTSGCAAIVGGTSEPVSVDARSGTGDTVDGANCKLQNSKGIWYLTTPGSVVVHRAYGDMQISCTKPGEVFDDARSKSKVRGWIFGNLLFGGLPGLIIDIATGAGYDYPTVIRMHPATGAAAPADAATNTAVDASTTTAAAVPSGPTIHAALLPTMEHPVPADMPTSKPAAIQSAQTPDAAVLPTVQRMVSGSIETLVAAHADLADMCRTNGPTPDIQVVERSRHGVLAIRQGTFFAPADSGPNICSTGQIYGTQIYYRPDTGFHGADRIRYAVATANGRFTREVVIEVK
ncbi:hypothetical protein AB4851_12560 [Burkholderia sp. 22PA0099]|uniref:hypothetical protein n=1 Tax=Burkholderia sp. 22PA0099 TaxID=3237372 RepID=UPI0039C14996